MKERGYVIFFIAICLISIISISNVRANEITDFADQIDIDKVADQIPKNSEDTKEIASDYLKKEWLVLLNKTKTFGPIIRTYEKISPYTDPVAIIIMGEKPGLNWFFFLSLAIWITLFVYISRTLTVFSTFSDVTSIVIAFGILIIFSIFGFVRSIANLISGLLGLATVWWVKLIGIVVFIVVLTLISIFSKKFEAIMRLWRIKRAKNKKEEQELLDRMRLRGYTNIAENYAKKISET